MTAFNADQLDARGIVGVHEQFTDLAGYRLIYLRGIGTDAFIPSADPVSRATSTASTFRMGTASRSRSARRIEVLKGSQGTLFGCSSTDGAVMMCTKGPGPTAETSAQASYARFDDSKMPLYNG